MEFLEFLEDSEDSDFLEDSEDSDFLKDLKGLEDLEEFKYIPLNLEKPAIRLLYLHPGFENMMISCELSEAELHQRDRMISYEALSYTWGCSELSGIIHVNGCCLRITHNLYSALVDLRYQDRQRVLWIDAVCIDQKNDKERGHQVGQMGNIYKEADRVIFRLGLGSVATDIFMESLQQLQKESIRHACRAWSRQDSRWRGLWECSFRLILELHEAGTWELRKGLREILKQSWFRRVWILQEVAFAKAGIISCGRKSVSARLFGLAPLLLWIHPDAHCQSVIDIMPSPWRESTWWSESRSFYKLLINFRGSEATDPRDLVYALRGMSSDLTNKCDDLLFPDYKKSQEKLVHDVIQYIYGFDVSNLKMAPRLSSMQELFSNLPRLETDIFRHLAEMSQPEHMERILKIPEILVSQDMIKAAAQYDKDGKVVDVLLRSRRGGFEIDDEVLLCAAANPNAAEAVFEAFRCHQRRPITTEQILIAAANTKYGPSPMRFLLSLKTKDYKLAPILWETARNTDEYSKKEIIGMLLRQNDFSNDTVSEILTVANIIENYDLQTNIIKTLFQKKSSSEINISEILTAVIHIRDFGLRLEIIKTLLQKKGSSNNMISEVVTAATKIQARNLQTEVIRILVEQKGNSNDTVSELLTAASVVRPENPYFGEMIIKALLKRKDIRNDTISKALTFAANHYSSAILREFRRLNPGFEISRDAVIVAMKNWPSEIDTFRKLCYYFPSLNPSREQVA
ncbi:hypothetical protein N5P37_006779 [Trichoderma harzianum]|nr:hypothetical protein N5P37_006779 [Trichoderma harzianum]